MADTILSVLFYGLAVLSKSACLTLVVIYPVMDFVLENRTTVLPIGKVLSRGLYHAVYNLKFIAIFIAVVYLTIDANENGMWMQSDVIYLTWPQRLNKVAVLFWWILGKILWPSELCIHYQLKQDDLHLSSSDESLLAWTATFLLLAIAGYQCWYRHRPFFLLTWGSVLAFVLPVSGIVQHGMNAKAADRYAYFPFLVLLPWLAHGLSILFTHQRRSSVLCVIITLMCTCQISRNQLSTWRTEQSVYERSLR